MSEEEVLLRLRRKYSKDEIVALISKRLSEVEFENGELKSEVEELKHEANVIKNAVVTEGTKTKKLWLKDELIEQYEQRLKVEKKKKDYLEKKVSEWRDKYFQLAAKHKIDLTN